MLTSTSYARIRRLGALLVAFVAISIGGGDLLAQSGLPTHDHPGCGTLALAYNSLRQGKNKLDLASLVGDCSGRNRKQVELNTSDGHFKIHFDTIGADAVSKVDNNVNGVPDYIDSVEYYLEYAWKVEIEQLGFAPPAPDGTLGGDSRVDAYICNLDRSVYGYAFPDDELLATNPPRASGYLALDNDYVGYPTPGIKGLAVTIAHEFNHVIQFSAYKFDLSQIGIYEATAVWFEQKVHPTIEDYRQYVDRFLESPQDYSFATNNVRDQVTGYGHVLFFDYLEKKLGRDIIRRVWETFATTNFSSALDQVLRRTGKTNLSNAFCEFAQWCYYTGHRAKDTLYFNNAAELPSMQPVPPRRELIGGSLVLQEDLYPLSFGLYQVLTPQNNPNLKDTVDFVVTNARSDVGAGGLHLGRESFTLSVRDQNQTDYTRVEKPGSALYYNFLPSTPHFCIDAIVNGTVNVTLAINVAPQPFVNDGANKLMIGVGESTETVRIARITIYGADMGLVADLRQTGLSVVNNQLGFVWDGRDRTGELAPSGIYIYELIVNDGEPMYGKLAVVRK